MGLGGLSGLGGITPRSAPLLYQAYGEPYLGASTRRISAAYSGPLVRVSKNNGAATLDVGADSSGVLDRNALLAFWDGTTPVYVSRWYLQNSAGGFFEQPSQSSQPQIVSSGGTVFTSGGRPALSFESQNNVNKDFLTYIAQSPLNSNLFSLYVQANLVGASTTFGRVFTASTGPSVDDWATTNAIPMLIRNDATSNLGVYYNQAMRLVSGSNYTTAGHSVHSTRSDGSNVLISTGTGSNNTVVFSITTLQTTTYRIGAAIVSNTADHSSMSGLFTDVVLYRSFMSSNIHAGIMSALASAV